MENEHSQDFLSNPNLKFIKIISKTNYCGGSNFNDRFEIFKSLRNKEVYLVSPNKNEYNIDIISLKTEELVTSLKGHNNFITIVKYYMNDKNNKNEYLLSSDKNNVIIIWDINHKYSIIDKIENHISKGFISSAIMLFNFKDKKCNIDDYIIFSFNIKYYTQIYSLRDKKKVGNINMTDQYNTYNLLLWYNKKKDIKYIIEFSNENIFIYDIIENSKYFDFYLANIEISKIISGFIYTKNNDDHLIFASISGIIAFLNLETKKIQTLIYFTKTSGKKEIYLAYLLQWSNRYMIVCENHKRGFKIIDIETKKTISFFKGKHTGGIIYAKILFHPNYGESLLTLGEDNTIILWSK